MTESKRKGLHCGMVTIVGRPNVGKSTLLNKILGEKVSIVSPVPQTTRIEMRGIHNDKRGQIIFLDTPGLNLGKDKLDQSMYKISTNTFRDADCIIYLMDVTRRPGEEEEMFIEKLKSVKIPLILGFNKVDMEKNFTPQYIVLWEKARGKSVHEMENTTLIALSGKKGINVDKLLDIVFDNLPIGLPLYPRDSISDTPQKLFMADIIREKLLYLMREEVPHSIGVVIEDMYPVKGKTIHVVALIIVERGSQKEIVIGKKGHILKKIGTLARQEFEELLESKVFLELYVKTQEGWREDSSILKDLGYIQQ